MPSLSPLIRIAATVAVLGAGIWAALCLWFRMPGGQAVAAGAALSFGAAALAALFGLWTGRWLWVVAYAAALAGIVGWFVSIKPQGDSQVWAADVSRTVTAEITPDRVVVHNVRDFGWRTPTQFEPRWDTREFPLDALETVDLFNSYWMGPQIAHTLVSFGFADGRHLVFSIEIRRGPGETFSNIAGFFKRYELAFIAADERDIVRLRSNVRGETVQVFRLVVTRIQAREALVGLLRRANDVAAHPAFYNTLASNCTTELFAIARAVAPGLPFDWRIIVSGYLPDYAYDQHLLDERHTLPELRRLGTIDAGAVAAGDAADFSAIIRRGLEDPPVAAAAPAAQ